MQLNELDLNKLHVFATVARSRTLTDAARELARSPSAVSQSVAALERALGVPLFRRLGNRLHLTDRGRVLASGLARHQSDLRAVLQDVSRAGTEVVGIARLGLFPGFPASRIGDALSTALIEHPGLELRLQFRTHAEMAEALARDRLDLALSLVPLERLHPAIRTIRSIRLIREELVLVSAPGIATTVRKETLAELPLIEYFQAPSLFRRWARHHFGTVPRKLHVRALASTLEYVLELTRRRTGYAVVPRTAIAADLEAGTLVIHHATRARGAKSQSELLDHVWLNSSKAGAAGIAVERLEALLKARGRAAPSKKA